MALFRKSAEPSSTPVQLPALYQPPIPAIRGRQKAAAIWKKADPRR